MWNELFMRSDMAFLHIIHLHRVTLNVRHILEKCNVIFLLVMVNMKNCSWNPEFINRYCLRIWNQLQYFKVTNFTVNRKRKISYYCCWKWWNEIHHNETMIGVIIWSIYCCNMFNSSAFHRKHHPLISNSMFTSNLLIRFAVIIFLNRLAKLFRSVFIVIKRTLYVYLNTYEWRSFRSCKEFLFIVAFIILRICSYLLSGNVNFKKKFFFIYVSKK